MTIQLGSRYQLGDVLGRGASGEVWSGTGPDGPVAIKLLRRELAEDPVVVERFVGERAVLVGLRSEHVVGVRDLVIEGDRLAIVMDLVEGGDLRSRLRAEGTLAPADAVELVAQVLEGLAAVHDAGVVHRDLKPENILIEELPTGLNARIADFGIARLASGARLTRTTGLLGTPRYVAPEVVQRGKAAPPADVYSAGVTLYELLFGAVPFDGPNPAAVLRAHLDDAPRRPEGVPDELWLVLAAMLAKNASNRPTATAAARQLRGLRSQVVGRPRFDRMAPARDDDDQTSITDPHRNATDLTGTGRRGRALTGMSVATTDAPSSRRWLAPVVAVVVVLALIGGGVYLVRDDDSGPTFAEASAIEHFRPDKQSPLVIDRTWGFGADDGSVLTGKVEVHGQNGSLPSKASFLEILPPELASNAGDVEWSQQPQEQHPLAAGGGPGKALRAGPGGLLARITVPDSGASFSMSYSIPIPAGAVGFARLDHYVEARRAAVEQYCRRADSGCKGVALQSIGFVSGAAPLIGVDQVANVGDLLEGRQNDGSAVPAGQVPGASYSVDKNEVATVDAHGEVRGIAAGLVSVTATVTGLPPATIGVTVQDAPVPVVTSIKVHGPQSVTDGRDGKGNVAAYSVEAHAADGRPVLVPLAVVWTVDPSDAGYVGTDGRFTSTLGKSTAAKGHVRAAVVNAAGKRVADVLAVSFAASDGVVSTTTSTGPGPTTTTSTGPGPTTTTSSSTTTPTTQPPTSLPDLIVTNITWDGTPVAGDCVTFHVTIQNIGPGPSPDVKHGILLYIDGDRSTMPWSEGWKTGLAPGAIRTQDTDAGRGAASCNLGLPETKRPRWLAVSGHHTIEAWVDDHTGDGNGEIDEVSGGNNRKSVPIDIP